MGIFFVLFLFFMALGLFVAIIEEIAIWSIGRGICDDNNDDPDCDWDRDD